MLYVPNMKCEHCIDTIREGIREKERHAEVDADLDRHELRMKLPDGRLTADGVREVLTELGYEVDGAERRRRWETG